MAFQTADARHTASPQGKQRNLAEHAWNPCGTLWSLVEILWNPCGTAPDHLQNQPTWSSGRTSCNPGALIEPYLNTPQPLQNLVEPCRNLTQTTRTTPQPLKLVLPWWNAGGSVVEDHPAALEEIGGTLLKLLVENLTSNHPGPPRSPCRTWWNFGGTLVTLPQTIPDHPAALADGVEPSWSPRSWNLASNHPGPPHSP